jgi:superoxide dismutase, Fe-Mn family
VTTRREALQSLVLAPALLAGAPAQPATEPFQLPPLGYAFDALEPYVDAQTMQIHHDRHHAAYVNNLNRAVAGHPEMAGKSVEDLVGGLASLPESIRTAVRNNGGGHANHAFFWKVLAKNAARKPKGELAGAIDKQFGGFEKFQEQFTKAALGVFGSGWAWLAVGPGKDLLIQGTSNQDSPWMAGHAPILAIDVWEHAYYLKYQNRRPEYVAAFQHVIDWDFVSERYRAIV